MIKHKNIIVLLVIFFMCFLVSCTGDPAEETEQVVYNTTFYSNQSTQATSKITETIYNSKNTEYINDESFVETVSSTDLPESTLNKQSSKNTNQTSFKNNKVVVDATKSTATIKHNHNIYTTNVKENEKTISQKVTTKNFDKTKTTKSTIITKVESVFVPEQTSSQNKTQTISSKTEYISTSKAIQTIQTTQTTQTTTLAPLRDDEICFITTNGEKYHRQGCRYLKRSCIEIIVRDAKEKEYTPCKVCKP